MAPLHGARPFVELTTHQPCFACQKRLLQWLVNNQSAKDSMLLNENNPMPFMKSLATCLNRMVSKGYTEDFRITDQGLEALQHHHQYKPDQIQIVNFYRFEGESDPDDNAILYVIETNDGTRGTLIDAYGVYHDERVSSFMGEVQNIQKKAVRH